MKKIWLFVLILVTIILFFYYIKINNAYKNLYNSFYTNIDSYEDKLKITEEKYKDVVNNINSLSDIKIDKTNDVKQVYKTLNNAYIEEENNNKKILEKIDSLKEEKQTLVAYHNKLAEEDRKRRTFIIDNVKTLNQYSLGYPNGCESVALTILLNYYGINVSVGNVVDILAKGDLPYYEDGIRYGGNPYLEFIGHPANNYSFGVYDLPIVDVANHYKPGIINGRGMSLNQVLDIVKQNRPVLVWNSINLAIPYISQSWIYKPTGEKINWLHDLHALIVIGFYDNQVVVSDPINGQIRYFDKSVFESRYNAFGKRALYY